VPVEIQSAKGLEKVMLSKQPMTLVSSTLPVIDPRVYYLKKVILE
jgi:hypothetical protein